MLSIKSMNYHKFIWKVGGVWSEHNKSWWYFLYSKLFLGIFFIIFPMCMVLNLMFVASLGQAIEIIYICSTCVLASVKSILLMMKSDQLSNLFGIMNEMDGMLKTNEQRQCVHVAIKESRKLVILLSFLYYGGVSFAFSLTFLSEDEHALMWPSWYPFIPYKTNVYAFYVMLIYQFIASLLVAFMDSSLDLYGATSCIILGAHLDALGLRLKNIGVCEPMEEKKLKSNKQVAERVWEDEIDECAAYHFLCIK